MRYRVYCHTFVIFLLFVLFFPSIPEATSKKAEKIVNHIKINGIINPVIADYVSIAIKKSLADGAQALLIELDTPGGLDLSMRAIVKEILNAPIAVIVFVSPAGARAASAGALITMAAHVSAMAPGTNIGAAHPVRIGGGPIDDVMKAKIENDAMAYARSIARKRGRNRAWAERAVRDSVSITAERAVEIQVVDVAVESIEKLFEAVDGKMVSVQGATKSLTVKGAILKEIEMDLKHKILNIVTNPDVAYLLMMLGFVGIYLELTTPGVILPGIAGAVALILSFVAFQTLPINYGGVLLILLGLILLFLEIKVVSYGLLTLSALASITMGSLMLFETTEPFLRVSYSVIFPTIAGVFSVFMFIIIFAIKSQKGDAKTGMEVLVGQVGEVREELNMTGRVFVRGELWFAKSAQPIKKGEKVKVTDINGMELTVKKFEKL